MEHGGFAGDGFAVCGLDGCYLFIGWGVLRCRRPFRETWGRLVGAAITLVFAVAAVRIFIHSGVNASNLGSMPQELALTVGRLVGASWPAFAAVIGALGAFVAGSATVSNMTFSLFQFELALRTGLDPRWIVGLQAVGAAARKYGLCAQCGGCLGHGGADRTGRIDPPADVAAHAVLSGGHGHPWPVDSGGSTECSFQKARCHLAAADWLSPSGQSGSTACSQIEIFPEKPRPSLSKLTKVQEARPADCPPDNSIADLVTNRGRFRQRSDLSPLSGALGKKRTQGQQGSIGGTPMTEHQFPGTVAHSSRFCGAIQAPADKLAQLCLVVHDLVRPRLQAAFRRHPENCECSDRSKRQHPCRWLDHVLSAPPTETSSHKGNVSQAPPAAKLADRVHKEYANAGLSPVVLQLGAALPSDSSLVEQPADCLEAVRVSRHQDQP